MSKYRYEMGGIIRDTEIDFPYDTDEIVELLDEKDQRIAELEQENESYQKLINDICNKHRVVNLKELDEMYQATKESLYASREYLEKLKSKKWGLEKARHKDNGDM